MISPHSSATISVTIDFKNSTQEFVKGKHIILSSECLQPEVKDWNHLSIFFQLIPAEVLTQVIYTNCPEVGYCAQALGLVEFRYN